MSVRVSTWAWKQSIRGNALLVLLALADQASDAGSCWPSQSTLAAKCGISERALQTHLAALEAGGYTLLDQRGMDSHVEYLGSWAKPWLTQRERSGRLHAMDRRAASKLIDGLKVA